MRLYFGMWVLVGCPGNKIFKVHWNINLDILIKVNRSNGGCLSQNTDIVFIK